MIYQILVGVMIFEQIFAPEVPNYSCPDLATEYYNVCGNHCQKMCETGLQGNQPCPDMCGPGACVCREEFYRNAQGLCVPYSECPRDEGVMCDAPPAPANGGFWLKPFAPGSSITYTCNHGYRMNGPASRECQPDGTWSGSAPTCEAS